MSTDRDLVAAREATDVLILPMVDNIEVRDWKAFDLAVAVGQSAALEALDRLAVPVTELRRRPSLHRAFGGV
jgi:NTE family protein